jgi:hypothetical protein
MKHRNDGRWRGLCLSFVRQAFGARGGQYDAKSAWHQAKHRHSHGTPPKGAAVFWLGHTHGHIAISVGGGKCLSTDIRRRGKADIVPISEIHRRWGLTYVGWSEDVNGVRLNFGHAQENRRDVPNAWYHVDPKKVSTGLRWYGSDWRVRGTRKPNFNVHIVATVTHFEKTYGITDSNNRYAMSYLAKGKH